MHFFFLAEVFIPQKCNRPYPRRDLGTRMDSRAVIQEVKQKYR
jgi:hypothetical protein